MTLEVMFAFLALFLAAKAIEHRNPQDQVWPIVSIGAWVCAAVAVVLALIP